MKESAASEIKTASASAQRKAGASSPLFDEPGARNGPLMSMVQRAGCSGCPPALASLAGRMAGMPAGSRKEAALSLQRTKGNRFVQGLTVQAKLMVGRADDEFEREADRVASRVLSIPEPATLQRQAGEDEERLQPKPLIQRIGFVGSDAGADLEQSIEQARGNGMPLKDSVRCGMERALGADFTSVRVHYDANADRLNRSVQARAFTTGQDIFFRQGEYRPGSFEGQEIIAHELTHVVQQCRALPQRHGPAKDMLAPAMPIIQRTSTFGNAPVTEVLGLDSNRIARAQLGADVYQYLKGLSVEAMQPFLNYPNTIHLLQMLFTNMGTLTTQALTVIINTLRQHMTGSEIATHVPEQADFLVANVVNIQLARNALVTAQNNVQQATVIMTYLTLYIADAKVLQVAMEVLASVQNNVQQATVIMTYLTLYIADAKVLQVAVEVLASVQNNVQQAKTQMDILAKYNYDSELRTKAEMSANQAADEEDLKAKKAAAEKKETAYKAIVEPPHLKDKATETKKREYKEKIKKVAEQRTEADEIEMQEIAQSEQGKEATKSKALGETEAFIARFTRDPDVGAESTKWIIEAAKFNVELANILVGLFNFAVSVNKDAKALSTWVLSMAGTDAKTLDRGVRYLSEAMKKNLAIPLAQTVTESLLKYDLNSGQLSQLADIANANPGEWLKVISFVEMHKPDMNSAIGVLEKAHAVSIEMDELVNFIGERKIIDINWLLEKSGTDLKVAKKALQLLEMPKVTGGKRTNLTWLLSMPKNQIFDDLANIIMFNELALTDVEVLFKLYANVYPEATLVRWIRQYNLSRLLEALQATNYEGCEKFVEFFIIYGATPNSSIQFLTLIRLDALLATSPEATLTVYQKDQSYVHSKNPPSRTGFLSYTFMNGKTAIIHTHWNVNDKRLSSMHIQDSGDNGTEINQWKFFTRVQKAVCDAHNSSVFSPTTNPPGGKLIL